MKEYDCPFLADKYYHVFNHAVGWELLALDEENYRYLLQQFQKYFLRVADLYCYNLLPNHFHIFLKTKQLTDLIEANEILHPGKLLSEANVPEFILQQFGNCFNSYTKSFNNWNNRKGRLFMESLKRSVVEDDDYFTKIIHYIHANAVQHGLCKTIDQWKHCSFHSFISDEPTFLKKENVLDWFGGLDGFIAFHQQPIYLKIKDDV